MATDEQLIAALRLPGTRRRLTWSEGGAQRQPPIGQPAPGEDQMTPEAAEFAKQIKTAQERGGGWTSTPIGTPDGRF